MLFMRKIKKHHINVKNTPFTFVYKKEFSTFVGDRFLIKNDASL